MLTAWYVTHKTMHACENKRIASTTCSSLASIRDTVWYVTPETMHACEKEELPAQHLFHQRSSATDTVSLVQFAILPFLLPKLIL